MTKDEQIEAFAAFVRKDPPKTQVEYKTNEAIIEAIHDGLVEFELPDIVKLTDAGKKDAESRG